MRRRTPCWGRQALPHNSNPISGVWAPVVCLLLSIAVLKKGCETRRTAAEGYRGAVLPRAKGHWKLLLPTSLHTSSDPRSLKNNVKPKLCHTGLYHNYQGRDMAPANIEICILNNCPHSFSYKLNRSKQDGGEEDTARSA